MSAHGALTSYQTFTWVLHMRLTYLPWSGHLCDEDYAHWKYFCHAITSVAKMPWNMRTSPNSLPPAIAFHNIQSVHLSASLRVPLLFIRAPVYRNSPLSFSLSSNKRLVCSLRSSFDWSRQLMHWSLLQLLFSSPDNAVLYSPFSIHISSKKTELQCKAAWARMECFVPGRKE